MAKLLCKFLNHPPLQIVDADARAVGRVGYVSLKTSLGALRFGGDRELLVNLLRALLEMLDPKNSTPIASVQTPPPGNTLIQPHWQRWKVPPEGLSWPFILWCFATSKALAVGEYPITLDHFGEDMKFLRPIIKRLKAELGIDEMFAVRGDGQSQLDQDVAIVREALDIAELFDENGHLIWGAVATIKEILGFDRNMGGVAHQRARAVADNLKNTTTTTNTSDTTAKQVKSGSVASVR